MTDLLHFHTFTLQVCNFDYFGRTEAIQNFKPNQNEIQNCYKAFTFKLVFPHPSPVFSTKTLFRKFLGPTRQKERTVLPFIYKHHLKELTKLLDCSKIRA